jgi:hypothetical protein
MIRNVKTEDNMKRSTIFAISIMIMAAVGSTFGQATLGNPAWNVTLTYGPQTTTRQMRLVQMPGGHAAFRFPASTIIQPLNFPAVWRRVTPGFMSFAGEVELPIGNVGRETGTLVLKATTITTTGTMAGPVIFIMNTPQVGAPEPYVIQTGSFTATRVTTLSDGE